jgi:hypothetical protein
MLSWTMRPLPMCPDPGPYRGICCDQQGARHPRDESSKGRIIQGTEHQSLVRGHTGRGRNNIAPGLID